MVFICFVAGTEPNACSIDSRSSIGWRIRGTNPVELSTLVGKHCIGMCPICCHYRLEIVFLWVVWKRLLCSLSKCNHNNYLCICTFVIFPRTETNPACYQHPRCFKIDAFSAADEVTGEVHYTGIGCIVFCDDSISHKSLPCGITVSPIWSYNLLLYWKE